MSAEPHRRGVRDEQAFPRLAPRPAEVPATREWAPAPTRAERLRLPAIFEDEVVTRGRAPAPPLPGWDTGRSGRTPGAGARGAVEAEYGPPGRWPELPHDAEGEREEAEVGMRAWLRLRRLDDEQQGRLWSVWPF